jgi:hypothetical protein
MIAMRKLTKVAISSGFRNDFATNITHPNPARTCHFVATVRLDKADFAFWASSDLGGTDSLFHFEAPFVLSFLLNNFFAAKRNVRLLSALATGFETAVFHGALENHLSRRKISLIATFGAGAEEGKDLLEIYFPIAL